VFLGLSVAASAGCYPTSLLVGEREMVGDSISSQSLHKIHPHSFYCIKVFDVYFLQKLTHGMTSDPKAPNSDPCLTA
jgi:hypothetical protein